MAENRLPAGMRNNNPGNIKYVGQRDSVGPSINTDQGDPQAVYPDEESGMTAAFNLALRKYRSGKTSTDALIAGKGGWTPGNVAAARNIAKTAGLSAYDDINLEDPASARAFMRGLITQEHGNASRAYTDDLIDRAYSKATGGKVTQVADQGPDIDALASKWGTPIEPAKGSSNPEADKRRKDALFYDKSNPEAARQLRAQADALDAADNPIVAEGAPDIDALVSKWGTPVEAPKADPNATRVAREGLSDVAPVTPTKEGELTANNVGRAFARGVPIIGGVLNKLNAATNAAIAPVGNQFFSPDEQLKGETFGERYANSLRQQEGMDTAFKEQNPLTNTALEVGGAIGATLPLAATAAGGRLLGVTGPTLAARAVASAKSGAAIGGIDNFIRSGDANEAARAAITGGALGGAIPVVAAGAGALARKGMEVISPVATRTANKLGEALKYSGNTIDDLKEALRANPRVAAVDADENIKGLAQGLAAQPGEAQAILREAVASRAEGAKGAVKGVFNEALGDTPNVPVLLDTLKKTTRDNAKKSFSEALKDAKPIELPEGEFTRNNINKIRETWDKVVSDIGDPTKLTQPELLHRVQSKLGEEARDLASSAIGSERTKARELEKLRSKIIDKLEDSTGGKFKAAQAQYKDDKAIEEAFDKGTSIFKGGSDVKNRPDFFVRDFAKASDAEKEAIKLGARTAVDNMIGQSKRAASTGAKITDSEFNLDKLRTVLGEKEANRLAKLLSDEVKIADVNNALLGGSQTEIRRGLSESVAPRTVGGISGVERGILNLSSVAAGFAGHTLAGPLGIAAAAAPYAISGARNIAQRVGRAVDVKSNADLARLITQTGEAGERGLERMAKRITPTNRLSSAINSRTTAVGRVASVPEINKEVEKSPLMITVRKKFSGGGS